MKGHDSTVTGSLALAVETGAFLSRDEARDLTERIKASVQQVWDLLVEAHERRAWVALGYGTWAEYVKQEFGVSKAYSYRLLDHGYLVREIQEATGGSPIGDPLPEGRLRALKAPKNVGATAYEPARLRDDVREALVNGVEPREIVRRAGLSTGSPAEDAVNALAHPCLIAIQAYETHWNPGPLFSDDDLGHAEDLLELINLTMEHLAAVAERLRTPSLAAKTCNPTPLRR